MDTQPILKVDNLRTVLDLASGTVPVIDGVSFAEGDDSDSWQQARDDSSGSTYITQSCHQGGQTSHRGTKDQPAECTTTILIADEPTTALDVTIQLQYLDLLKKFRRKRAWLSCSSRMTWELWPTYAISW